MPGLPPPVADERGGLLTFLDFQRQLVRTMAYGLTDEQSRATPSASTLSVGGIVKHLAQTERSWVATLNGAGPRGSLESYQTGFLMGPDETLVGLLDDYGAAAAETTQAITGRELDDPVPIPDQPWFPKQYGSWSVRWVLLHLIEETARHVGHADIIRESVDKATWYPLMAAVDGVPPAPWIVPWQKAG